MCMKVVALALKHMPAYGLVLTCRHLRSQPAGHCLLLVLPLLRVVGWTVVLSVGVYVRRATRSGDIVRRGV